MSVATLDELRNEYDRGEQDLEHLIRFAHILRSAKERGETVTSAAFGLLNRDTYRQTVEAERSRCARCYEDLALVEVAIDRELSRTEEIVLALDLRRHCADKPGEAIGRTQNGYGITYPWTGVKEAEALARFAAQVVQDRFPDATISYGSAVLRDERAPIDAIHLDPYRKPATVTPEKNRTAVR